MTGYVLASSLWSVAGLVVGYFLGRARPTHHLCQSEEAPVPSSEPTPRRTWWARHGDQVVGVSLIVLALASVILAASFLRRQQAQIDQAKAQTACQNAYNEDVYRWQLDARETATLERNAMRKILDESFKPNRSVPAIVDAYHAYQAVIAEVDQRRAESGPAPVRQC